MSFPDQSGGSWTLLTGHGHVLVEIARNPTARIRDISAAADITERTAQATSALLPEVHVEERQSGFVLLRDMPATAAPPAVDRWNWAAPP